MATSRTATGKWKRLRKDTIASARARGQTHCPLCQRPLDYGSYQKPDSAEVDHIVPYSRGGTDTPDNVRVICRDCNGKRESRENRAEQARVLPTERRTTTSRQW